MRYTILFIFFCLPLIIQAQEIPPLIVVDIVGNIYAVAEDTAEHLHASSRYAQFHLSPDGTRLAIVEMPPFLLEETQLEPGDYPDNLLVIDTSNGEITSLVQHGDDVSLSEGDNFYNGDYNNGVRTDRGWDEPNNVFGSRLRQYLAWSPDSSQIAHIQTIVSDGNYPGEVRLVVFDVETGEMSILEELGRPNPGYAVFWLEEGIVLYTDPKEGNDTITVYSPDGEVLNEWDLGNRYIAHENPMRVDGKDYIVFPQWNLFDLTTGEFTYLQGALALASAREPETSLHIEACDDREKLQPTWDVYSPDGEKLVNLTRAGSVTLSPDGQQVVYYDWDDRSVMVFDGEETQPFSIKNTPSTFRVQAVIWGATVYTITPVGAEDCFRLPRG